MPNCFSLTRIGASEPINLVELDDELREEFNEPEDAHSWLYGWYDYIGFAYACGHDNAKCREIFEGNDDLQKVIDYLEANFTCSAWAEIGRLTND